jgi:hypothetical protein
MSPAATLMIIELLASERAHADPAGEMTAIMDLYMLSIFDGKERTRDEFTALLAGAGFAVREITPLSHGMAAIAATPVH